MKSLWIVGGAGAALEVWAVLRALEASARMPYALRGFILVEAAPEFDAERLEIRAEQEFLNSASTTEHEVVLAVGSPRSRAGIAERFSTAGFRFPILVHPQVIVGPHVSLGPGSVVMAGSVLETHVSTGSHALINVQTSLAHECRLGDCCSLGPGVHLGGRVRLGDRCDLGVGAVIRPGVTLGADLVVGAGAAVVEDHQGPGTLVGVPARLLKR